MSACQFWMDEVNTIILGCVNIFGGLIFGYNVGVFADASAYLQEEVSIVDRKSFLMKIIFFKKFQINQYYLNIIFLFDNRFF